MFGHVSGLNNGHIGVCVQTRLDSGPLFPLNLPWSQNGLILMFCEIVYVYQEGIKTSLCQPSSWTLETAFLFPIIIKLQSNEHF